MSNGAIELYIIDDVCANRRLNVEWYSGDSIVEDLSFYIEIRQARFFLSVTHHGVPHHAEPAVDTLSSFPTLEDIQQLSLSNGFCF